MTPSLLLRSCLALALGVVIAAGALTHATIPPTSAISAAVNGQGSVGPMLTSPVLPPPRRIPPAIPHASPAASVAPNATPSATPSPRAVAIPPGEDIPSFPDVPGHIFYDDPHHNLHFITGHHAQKQFTGDGSSVAPALSPDGHRLAWVELERNYSDLYLTSLRFMPDGAVKALNDSTSLTQDQYPPPSLQAVPSPPGYQPSYEWWAQKPAWLPDGQHLLYLSDRPGYDPNYPEAATMRVWEQGVTATITDAVSLTTPSPGTGGDDSAAWRPHDPAVFIYVNYYSDTGSLAAGEGIIEAAMAITGTAPQANPQALTPHGKTEELPAWSPDGHYIAFIEDENRTGSNLLVMPFHRPGSGLDYYHAVTVAVGAPYVTQPFWSPDGKYLGYVVGGNGTFSLVIRRAYLNGPGGAVHFGPPIALPQAGAVSAEYRPTWGP